MDAATLNHISDDGAESLRSFYQNVLDTHSSAIDQYEALFNLGLLSWRSGDKGKTHQLLLACCQKALTIISSRSKENKTAQRTAHKFEFPLFLTLLFGNKAELKTLSSLSRSDWCQPETEEYSALGDLFELLSQWETKNVDVNTVQRIIDKNKSQNSNHFYRPWINAMCTGLLAIIQKESVTVVSSIESLLELHRQLSQEGDWQYLVEGLLAFWASALLTISNRQGLALTIQSEYLFVPEPIQKIY